MRFGQLYFSFEGRISRSTYWLKGYLPLIAIAFVFSIMDAIVPLGAILVLIGLLIIAWAWLAISAKRWHDRDKSAWWMLIVFIPIIGEIWALVELGFLKGTDGENRFGLDPLKLQLNRRTP